MKRFYTLSSSHQVPGGWDIRLDGKPVKMPSGATLTAPNQEIADLSALEWSAQGDEVRPETMPITQTLMTAYDRVCRERSAMTPSVIAYLDTDLVCYRAEDDGLFGYQSELWDVYLNWFEKRYGGALQVTQGLVALTQEEHVQNQVRNDVDALDDLKFSILQIITSGTGSLVIALYAVFEMLDPDSVLKASFAEEDYKDRLYDIEKYGADPSIEKSKKVLYEDLNAVQKILKTL